MTIPTLTQVEDLRRKIEARYHIEQWPQNGVAFYCVVSEDGCSASDVDHDDPLDAEAEMEAIIQADIEAELDPLDEAEAEQEKVL